MLAPMAQQTTVTSLLERARGVSPRRLLDRLFPLVYEELREMAHRQLARERDARTLDTTALVHECYLKLAGGAPAPIRGRRYFFGAAARAMRQVLVDAARRRRCLKRGEGRGDLPFDEQRLAADAFAAEVLELEDALVRLAASHARAVRVVECRFFAGLSPTETAAALEISERTVTRDWTLARAWLGRELSNGRPRAAAG